MTQLTTREEIDNLKQYTSFLKKEIEELRDRLEQLYENQPARYDNNYYRQFRDDRLGENEEEKPWHWKNRIKK